MKPDKAAGPAADKAPGPAPDKAPGPILTYIPQPPGGLATPSSGFSWKPVIQFKTPSILIIKSSPNKLPTVNQASVVSGNAVIFGTANTNCKYQTFSWGSKNILISIFNWKTQKVSFNMISQGKIQVDTLKRLKGVYYGGTSTPTGTNASKILNAPNNNTSAACYFEPLSNSQTRITFYQQIKN